jgi:hypothetical protein
MYSMPVSYFYTELYMDVARTKDGTTAQDEQTTHTTAKIVDFIVLFQGLRERALLVLSGPKNTQPGPGWPL